MSDFWTTLGGCIAGLFMILAGVMLVLVGGTFMDQTESASLSAGLDMGVGTDWDATGHVAFFRNIFYLICVALPIMGLVVMYLSITRRQRYDELQQDYTYDEY
jgi:preprotein translocase subunit SecG